MKDHFLIQLKEEFYRAKSRGVGIILKSCLTLLALGYIVISIGK